MQLRKFNSRRFHVSFSKFLRELFEEFADLSLSKLFKQPTSYSMVANNACISDQIYEIHLSLRRSEKKLIFQTNAKIILQI